MTVNPRQSFKLKLFLSILISSFICFLLIFAGAVYYTQGEIKDSVAAIVTSKLSMATTSLNDHLDEAEISSDNLIGIIQAPFFRNDGTDSYEVGKHFLDVNPRIQGICVGYEDDFFKSHKGGYCPYIMRHDGEYIMRNLAETKDYRESEWYSTPIEKRVPTWSKPFRESNGTVIVSYNVPIFNPEDGNPVCVIAVDQSLSELSDSLQALCPYEGSCIYVVDQDGRYLAHPCKDSVFVASAPSNIIDFIASDKQYLEDKNGSDVNYLFPAKIERTGWTVLLSVPRKAMLTRPERMVNGLIIDMIIGLLLLLAGSMFVINRLTKPLETFSLAAREISHGNFKVDLPVIQDHNELYDLRAALASMEVSLDTYIKQLEETSGKKAAIEKELDIARNIQMAMVPKIFPPYPNRDSLDIYASLTPAQAVGGDLYDFVLLGDRFFFCIGDVSGKGVPASLLMAITRTLFRNTASAGDKTPSQIAKTLNDAISEGNEMGMFVTMMIGCFNLVSGQLDICNCGHNRPATNGEILDPSTMTVTPGAPFHLMNGVPTNIAVGVMPGFEFKEVRMNITPGSALVLYTDGVTEAENVSKELYDDSRMLACLDAHAADDTCESVVRSLVSDVRSFTGTAAQSDDITVLCLRCRRLGK